MKIVFIIFILAFWSGQLWADELADALIEQKELKKVKYYLIQGETRLARLHLSKMASSKGRLSPVIHRYLAMLEFIEGRYEESMRMLDSPLLQDIPHFSKICSLKVLNRIILSKTAGLDIEWERCKRENFGHTSNDNLIWMDVLVEMKVSPRPGVTKIPFKRLKLASLNNDETKILLKLAIYLNQQDLIIDEISTLTMEQMKDQEIRELAGALLFRSGSLAQAYKFIEDLKSPHSENIKGNLYVLRGKYELAYAQFKVALEGKQNSQNSLERLLPLAWILKDWDGGIIYSKRLSAIPKNQVNRLTLLGAFLMQKGSFDESQKVLDEVIENSQKGQSLDVNQLGSFVSVMRNKPELVKKHAISSCSQNDLVNCWLLFQMTQWDQFPLTIRRDENIAHKKEWEKLGEEELNSPISETVYVNQLDIQEMDDKNILLIPAQTP